MSLREILTKGIQIDYDFVEYSCPNGKNKCHYHTNPLRRLIHDIHCYIIKCKYGRIENARR